MWLTVRQLLPARSGILAEAISIAFTSIQQRQSISLASYLQCPHLHQSRFPGLVCNKSAAEAWICLVFFLVALIPVDITYFNMEENGSWSIRLISKAAGKSRPATLFKKSLWHRCLSVNFEKFLRTPFFTEHFWWWTSGDLIAFLCD